ncbi:hypothetical protein PMAA_093610 [Talaromyces marneffei ATCC 18224]|uniref:Uncharacterized protein n=1 Tax=Talaromyces marneffei (strain ATCC 18224 / CBS 334.59 / QM 7333) TaxID=441960 RepID=B6QHA0_TALMQ|nr:hypothetical protein PMAA_093610 [Talaromyces marneffei ATCC 18224]
MTASHHLNRFVSESIRPQGENVQSYMTKSNATSSPQQTAVAHSTNKRLEAMTAPQPPFVLDDDVGLTSDDSYLTSANESHTCKDSSDSFSSSSFPSASPHPSNTTEDSSVLLQGLHDSYPRHHNHIQDTTQYLFQNLSLSESDNKNPDTSTPMSQHRKIPLSRLPASSSKNEKRVKKAVRRQKCTRSKFACYRQPGAMAAIASALEALEDPGGDEGKGAAQDNSFDDGLVIRRKYNSADTSPSTMTEEHAWSDSSTIQHQGRRKQDIMRITSVLNDDDDDPAPLVSSPPPTPISKSSVAASQSSPQASSFGLSDRHRHIEHSGVDVLDHINIARNQLAKSSLRDEYMRHFTNPERRRYEDALVEIVGDLELPF